MSRKENDIRDVYRSEKSRGSRHQEHPDTIAAKRLEEKVIDLIIDPGCELRDVASILREYGLQDDSKQFLRYMNLWHQYHGTP